MARTLFGVEYSIPVGDGVSYILKVMLHVMVRGYHMYVTVHSYLGPSSFCSPAYSLSLSSPKFSTLVVGLLASKVRALSL